jgi:hypothetical protein
LGGIEKEEQRTNLSGMQFEESKVVAQAKPQAGTTQQ